MAKFESVVYGLRRAYAADGHAELRFDGLALLSETQSCVNYVGDTVTCPAPSSAVHTFTVTLTGLYGAADYYAIGVHIDGPVLDGAECKEQVSPTGPGPCSTNGVSSYDGVVAPGDWVMRDVGDPLGYVAVPSAFSADGGFGGVPFSHTWWPDDYHGGLLVNPAPALPVPGPPTDNYYTMVLFTPGQMPASIDVEITHSNYEQIFLGRMNVGVRAYDIAEEDLSGGQVMYVGAA